MNPVADCLSLSRWGFQPGQILADFIGNGTIYIGPANKIVILGIFFYKD